MTFALLITLHLVPAVTLTSQGVAVYNRFAGVPFGSCYPSYHAVDDTNGDFYDCLLGTWHKVSSGGGGGSVTSFSAGNLSPLFTTSVATPTTTPALSFTLTNAPADSIFGNFSGSSGPPSYQTGPIPSSLLPQFPVTIAKVSHEWLDSYTSSTGLFTQSQPAFTDISGTVSDSQLANAYSGVGSCSSHNWINALTRNAAPTCSQPAFSDISGTASTAQIPNPAGDVTGTYAATTVTGVHFGATGLPLSSTAPTSGQFLQYNGTSIVGSSSLSLIGLITPSDLHPPVLANFSWVNQNGASVVANSGGAVDFVNSTTNTTNISAQCEAVPASTPWTLRLGFIGGFPKINNASNFGSVLRESSTGKLIVWTYGTIATTPVTMSFNLASWTSPTSGGTTIQSFTPVATQPIIWEEITDNGTQYSWAFGVDGQQGWNLLTSQNVNTFFTTAASQICFGGRTDNTTQTSLIIDFSTCTGAGCTP